MDRFNDFYKDLDLIPLRDLCVRNGVRRTYARGEKFLEEGEVCHKIGLVVSGCFRYVVRRENGSEGIVGFVFPNEYVTDFSNSRLANPSSVSIVAGKTCEVLEIGIDAFMEECRRDFPELEVMILHVLFHTSYKRFLDLYRFSAKERYMKLVSLHPQLLQEVPLRDVASYLMISPIHLSRIRRELLKGER